MHLHGVDFQVQAALGQDFDVGRGVGHEVVSAGAAVLDHTGVEAVVGMVFFQREV